jgi:hypothetical protein
MEISEVVPNKNEGQVANTAESTLEMMLIKQYLASKGFTLTGLKLLPAEQAKSLFTEACRHSSLKLAEIESTESVWAEIQGDDSSAWPKEFWIEQQGTK